jgi:hypothetical protein
MPLFWKTAAATLCATVLASTWMLGASDLSSRWKDRDIQVDGLITDWSELVSFNDGLSIAAVNSGRELYLAIATSDAQRRSQLVATGLVIWLDADGGKKEKYGIRIPGTDIPRSGSFNGRSSGSAPDPPQPRITYIELLGPEKDARRRIELAVEPPILAAARIDMGTLLYELRIPLGVVEAENSPYALRVRVDRPLGLGLKTPKPDAPAEEPGRGGAEGFGGRGRGGMGGGMGGMGGGRDGGMRGGMAGRGLTPPKAIDRWTKLRLATAP